MGKLSEHNIKITINFDFNEGASWAFINASVGCDGVLALIARLQKVAEIMADDQPPAAPYYVSDGHEDDPTNTQGGK